MKALPTPPKAAEKSAIIKARDEWRRARKAMLEIKTYEAAVAYHKAEKVYQNAVRGGIEVVT